MHTSKTYILPFLGILSVFVANAQKVDSLFFHLYTDSLKKGTHNYINIDGKLSNGRWVPLTSKEVKLTSDYGTFEGNDLVLPAIPSVEKIRIRAELIQNPVLSGSVTIWIKKKADDENLPTVNDVMHKADSSQNKKKKRTN